MNNFNIDLSYQKQKEHTLTSKIQYDIQEYMKTIGMSKLDLIIKSEISEENIVHILTTSDLRLGELLELVQALDLEIRISFHKI